MDVRGIPKGRRAPEDTAHRHWPHLVSNSNVFDSTRTKQIWGLLQGKHWAREKVHRAGVALAGLCFGADKERSSHRVNRAQTHP